MLHMLKHRVLARGFGLLGRSVLSIGLATGIVLVSKAALGVCVPLNCNDFNPCTNDACVSGTCTHSNKANGTACDDGNQCSGSSSCSRGNCVGTNWTVCTPSDSCHTSSCLSTSGACVETYKGNGQPCNDGNACTQTDTCGAGEACIGSNPVVCTALDQCHAVGTCNTGTGVCSNPPLNNVECNDGNACSTEDTCTNGVCVGSAFVECQASTACRQWNCDPGDGECYPQDLGNGRFCDDGLYCTQGDVCASGECVGSARDCSTTAPCFTGY